MFKNFFFNDHTEERNGRYKVGLGEPLELKSKITNKKFTC